jgi:hypothetical protein
MTDAAIVVILLIGGVLVVGGLLYAVAHYRAWDPAWARSSRHAVGEAGARASATWAEFVDWVRLGR